MYIAMYIHLFTHQWQQTTAKRCRPNQQEHLRVQYLPQGHLDMWGWGLNRPVINAQPAVPPEPQPP